MNVIPLRRGDFEDVSDERAIEITNTMLEQTRRGYVLNDFEMFARCFELPHRVGTFEVETMMENRTALFASFNAMRAYFEQTGVIDLYRRCINAAFHGPDEIKTTYLCRHVLKGGVFGDDLVAHAILNRRGGVWKTVRCTYATQSKLVTDALTPLADADLRKSVKKN